MHFLFKDFIQAIVFYFGYYILKVDPIDFIRNFGLDVKNFVNEKDLAQALVDADGWGIMNGYDGNYDSMSVNNETYYVMRVE